MKRAGSTVIIENPDTTAYPGMPLSLAPSVVDIVANRERVGEILDYVRYVRRHPEERQRPVRSFLIKVAGFLAGGQRRAIVHRPRPVRPLRRTARRRHHPRDPTPA